MKKREVKNAHLKALALALALALWFYVGFEKNPLEARTLQVPVVIEHLANDLSADLQTKQIGVTVRGRSDSLRNLNNEDIVAKVDLSKAKVGDDTYPVEVTAPKGISVADVKPDKITVSVREANGKHFKVETDEVGALPENRSLEGVAIDPVEVFVEGGPEVIAHVKRVAVELDLSAITESGSAELPVVVYDENDWPLDDSYFKLRPETVTVRYRVKEQELTKEVPVQVPTSGSPAAGYVLADLDIDPTTVTLSGGKEDLANINAVATNTVNLDGLKSDKKVQLRLQVPDELKVKGSQRVEALLRISRANGGFVTLPIQIYGAVDGESVSLSTSQLNVSDGAQDGASAWVDVSGLGPGTYQLNVQTSGIDGNAFAPMTVEVTIT